jgi:hypothetical protein
MVSFAPFNFTQRRGDFLFVDKIGSTINLAKIPVVFDLKRSLKVVDNYVLKQWVFEGKGIKKIALFTSSTGGA